MNFAYTAKSNTGTIAGGVIAADSLADVRKKLREQGLFAMTIKPAAGGRAAAAARAPRGRRVPKRELLTMTSQLSVMSRSGVDLASALRSISEQATHPGLKAALQRVHEAVSAGKPVSAALREQDEVFGGAYIASVAAGEASGKLPEVLARMSEMLRKELRQQATVRTLMAYPIVLTLVSTLVIGVLVLFVLPQFAEVFDQLKAPLPAITRLLLDGSDQLRQHFVIWSVGLTGLTIWMRFYLRSNAGRRRIDALKLNIAVLRNVTRPLTIGRLLRLLGTMLESGVPLLEALRLTRGSVSNKLYQELFDRLEQAVLNGRDMHGPLTECAFVPPAAAQMIATGERTGNLASVAQVTGEFYEEEGETRLKDLATVLEPLIIVIMGVIVATVVMSVMLPMFDFATMAERGGQG